MIDLDLGGFKCKKKRKKATTSWNRTFGYDRVKLLFAVLVLVIFTCPSGYAQVLPGVDPTGRAGEEPKPLPKELTPVPIPPIQVLPPPPIPSEEKGEKLPFVRLFVREIQITGNKAFSGEELAKVTAPYVNRELTSEDLESIRIALTLYYIERGYINSGAIIPDQTVTHGVITFHIIEGKLTQIVVEGNDWFSTGYIKDRVALGTGPPLNLNVLQQRLQLLQQDERIQRLNAELKPGVMRGESVLDLRVKEANPFKIWIDFDNYQSPTVGAERGRVTIAHQNLTGHGDILSFAYGQSSGIKPMIDTSYTLPFTAYDTAVNVRYRKNDFAVVEAPFNNLNISSKSDIFGITLRQPLYRTLNHEFALALTGEYERHQTYLDGEPFSFSPGYVNGEADVAVLRFSQEWVYRALAQVIAVRSRFSLGIDALGATSNPSGVPDSQFFAWLFQFQWARRLEVLDMHTIFRLDTQLANVSLLPLEQISVGGRYSVRGYRENQFVRDDAIIASLETRIPVFRNKPWADVVEIVPFVDFAQSWHKDIPTTGAETIGSVGLGLRWEDTVKYPFQWRPQFEIYWGIPLRKVDTPGGNLQDSGISFRFLVAVF